MPSEDKSNLRGERTDRSGEIDGLLAKIEGEAIPERLLILAQELQNVLNARKRQLHFGQK